MPYFRLSPVEENLGHPDWEERSTYKGFCHVTAKDERMARLYADEKFGKAGGKTPGQPLPGSPWKQVHLVDCVEVAYIAGDLPPEGLVTIPDDE